MKIALYSIAVSMIILVAYELYFYSKTAYYQSKAHKAIKNKYFKRYLRDCEKTYTSERGDMTSGLPERSYFAPVDYYKLTLTKKDHRDLKKFIKSFYAWVHYHNHHPEFTYTIGNHSV